MTNVIPLKTDVSPVATGQSEPERRLVERFGISERQLRDAIRPLFLLMHDHGVTDLAIARDGTQVVISVDGKVI